MSHPMIAALAQKRANKAYKPKEPEVAVSKVPGDCCTDCASNKHCENRDLKPTSCMYKNKLQKFGR